MYSSARRLVDLSSRSLVLLGVLLLIPVHSARASFHYQSTRVFEGTRYLSLSSLRVFDKPDSSSLIVADVLKGRLVYAIPNLATGWAAITGMGTRLYPDNYSGFKGNRIQLVNGKFEVMRDRIDRDDYYPLRGYVELKYLGNIDEPYRIPIAPQSLMRLPSPWHDLGIDERRFVSADEMAYPFSSVALLQTSVGSCSGVLIESENLIATAGHCVDEKNPGAVQVRFIHEPEPITATVIGSRFDINNTYKWDAGEDWALLRLSHPPTIPRRPINLPSVGSWMKAGSLELLNLGFAGDEFAITRKLFGDDHGLARVHGDICSFSGDSIEASRTNGQFNNLFTPTNGAECLINHGDSGGPLLVWNAERGGYELLGVTSWIKTQNDPSSIPDQLTPEALKLFNQVSSSIQQEYGYKATDANYAAIPGIAAVAKAIGKSVDYYNEQAVFYLHRNLVSAILAATGSTRSADDVYSIFKEKNVAAELVSDDPESQVNFYDMIDESELKNFRFKFYATWMQEALLDPRYQLKLSVGDTLDLNSMQSNKVPFAAPLFAHMFFVADGGDIDAGYELMQKEDYNEEQAIALLHGKGVQQQSIDSFTEHMRDSRMVIVGGDAFIVDKRNLEIKNVFRNFAGIAGGDIENVRIGRYYNWGIENPQNDGAMDLKSDVQPTSALRPDNFGAMTPASIPGGKVVGVPQVWRSILIGHRGKAPAPVVIAAISDEYGVPTATNLSFAAAGGDFNDAKQKELEAAMKQLAPDKDREIVVYCHHTQCWLSYNLALRLIALGYTNVEWMRDGIQGWVQQGLPIVRISSKHAENSPPK
jgi:rhodanese-related sulfurtransferase/V8-like Glu-specific endopeptidase